MKDGKKLLGELGELGPTAGVLPRAQSADHRRRHAGAEVGLDQRLHRGRQGQSGLRLDDRRPHLRHLSAARREAVRADRLHARGAVDPARALSAPLDAAAKHDEIFTGWAYPPKDYAKWARTGLSVGEALRREVRRAEVEHWYWEVWNEPNIGYWQGTPEEFFKLHDYAIDGVRRRLPTARVGGPDAAGGGGSCQRDFLEHCLRGTNYATGEIGTPIDFISFHAKGSPTLRRRPRAHGHRQSASRRSTTAFAIIASFPELKNKPIVIGESDPDGCAACQGPQLGYRNGTMYSSYTAASFARKLDTRRHARREPRRRADLGVRVRGPAVSSPASACWRPTAIDLPVLNVFRMFGKMSGERVAVESSGAVPLDDIMRSGVRGEKPDVSALASVDGNKMFVLAWHYHDDDVPGPTARRRVVAARICPPPAQAQARPIPHRSRSQQRVHRLAEDGLAQRADAAAVRRSGAGRTSGNDR